MALTDYYNRAWEEYTADRYIRNCTVIEFSNQNWMDVVDVLRDLSVDLSSTFDTLKEVGKGDAYGSIEIGNRYISGIMRFNSRDPILHEYTLMYEICSDPSRPNAYFELTEGAFLPIDKSYIPQMVDYMLFKFPGASIMTRRINTFDYYTHAI